MLCHPTRSARACSPSSHNKPCAGATLACAPAPALSRKPLRLKFQLRRRNNYPPLHISSKMVANAGKPSHRLPPRPGAHRRAGIRLTFPG